MKKKRPFGEDHEELRGKTEGCPSTTGGVTARTKKKDHMGKAFA